MPTRIIGKAEAQESTVTATAKIAAALARRAAVEDEGGHGALSPSCAARQSGKTTLPGPTAAKLAAVFRRESVNRSAPAP